MVAKMHYRPYFVINAPSLCSTFLLILFDLFFKRFWQANFI